MASDRQVSFTSFRLMYQLLSKPSILTSGSSVKEEQWGKQNGGPWWRREKKEERRRITEEGKRDGERRERVKESQGG